MDLFRNDWMVEVDDELKIPVPIISNDVAFNKRPFLTSLRRHSLDLDGLSEILDDECFWDESEDAEDE